MSPQTRPGSRPHTLENLEVGSSHFFQVKKQSTSKLMQQISVDISRVGLNGRLKQEVLLAIQPTTKQVVELVMVTRVAE